MKRLALYLLLVYFLCLACAQPEKTTTLKILQTSDVHGAIFPYDFINNQPMRSSLAQAYTYIKAQREIVGKNNVLLLDNGDNLQGQPTVYYYNFIDTADIHILSRIMNFMEYDATSVGNHDIEAGHGVYDRLHSEYNFPMLCANIINTNTGELYFTPYKTFVIDGIKITVLGLITPHVPHWLPENLWSGMQFTDMIESAKHWVKIISDSEKPHFLIGLFHSGANAGENADEPMNENASVLVAQQVPGFDAVFIGHDHQKRCETVTNINNDTVWILNPANNALYISDLELTITHAGGKVKSKRIHAKLVDVQNLEVNDDFKQFDAQFDEVEKFVSTPIGIFTKTITSRDAYFGPSAFVDLIHRIQLDVGKADISFAAPLSFDTKIMADTVYVRDMFKLYRYENLLYAMELTGKEIKDFLEFSYGLWINHMKSADDHLLLLRKDTSNSMRNGRFVHPSYNFDSAAGIFYQVDASKAAGERITISKLSNGEDFLLDKTYRVAINSYRGNGGGDHLTIGAGISKDDLPKRIVYATDVDLRYYLMKWIENEKIVNPTSLNEWKIVPENWVKHAAKRDYKLIFGNN